MLKRNGQTLALFLLLWPLLFSLALFVNFMARGSFLSLKARTLAEMSALSSERINAESLEDVAERWRSFGAQFGPILAPGRVNLAGSFWDGVRQAAQELRRALPGYQGRATAVIKVVAEANGATRDRISAANGPALLGLSPQSLIIQDETGRAQALDAGWYNRAWDVRPSQTHTARLTFASLLLERRASARVVWDVNSTEAASGNGGYPRTWADAERGGRLDPYRWARFRAERTSR